MKIYIVYENGDSDHHHAIIHFEAELSKVFPFDLETKRRAVYIPPHEISKETGKIRIFLGRSEAYALKEAKHADPTIWEASQKQFKEKAL